MTRLIYIMFLGLMIISCGKGSEPESVVEKSEPASIYNVTWQWESTVTPVEKITIQEPERYTVIFSEDGKAVMQFDCNRGNGNFTIAENRISFGPLISTRMACPEDSLDTSFTRDLERVASFFLKDGKLYLELPMDNGTMCFRPEKQG